MDGVSGADGGVYRSVPMEGKVGLCVSVYVPNPCQHMEGETVRGRVRKGGRAQTLNVIYASQRIEE